MNAMPPGLPWAQNVDAVGYADLDAKPAFKLAIHEAGGKWYLYIAHLWHSGWTVLDVTDPAQPRQVRFIEGPENTWTIQVQVAEGRMITSLERIAPGWGGDADKPSDESVLIWDLADPEDPQLLGQYRAGGGGTHRNYYDGGRYVHLSLHRPGYKGQFYEIIDIDDPANPTEVSRWWVPGQWEDGGESGAPPFTMLHGGAYVVGDRAYLPYGAAGFVILDISDITAPRLMSRLPFAPPFNPFVGVHSAVPLPGRDLVVVNSEAIKEDCNEPLNFTGLVDIADETAPRLISLFPLPVPPPDSGFRNFAEVGGRFGPHNQHQHQYQDVLLESDRLVFMTYFNAGLRIFDTADPQLPVEVGYFVPPPPTERRGPLPSKLIAQSEDVVVDARGNIYMSDKNHGVYILRAADNL